MSIQEETAVDPSQASVWKRIITARGKRYAVCKLSEFDIGSDQHQLARSRAIEQIASFCSELEANNASQNLILAGPSGSGKDHLMFYALRFAVMRGGVKASWVDGQRLFSELRDGITDGRTEREILTDYLRADVLAISDPVPPNGSLGDHQRNVLYRLIDERYSHCRPIWMTVNASSPAELDSRMGVQLVDRLLHDAVAVNCFWPSYRRVKR